MPEQSNRPDVRFRRTGEAFADFDRRVAEIIDEHGFKSVCEIGGGANPLLPLDFVQERGLDYAILDISQEELDKAPDGYRKLCGDITGDSPFQSGQFDFVFSKMLAEHVVDGRRFHLNVLEILKPDGYAFHFFPTLYAFPFLLNHMIPEAFSLKLLRKLNPDRFATGKTNKFPAHYSWTKGPTRGQMRAIKRLGYEIVAYTGLVGHEGYYRKLKPLQALHNLGAKAIIALRIPYLTSYAYLELRKPER